jgi:hypothetical protein
MTTITPASGICSLPPRCRSRAGNGAGPRFPGRLEPPVFWCDGHCRRSDIEYPKRCVGLLDQSRRPRLGRYGLDFFHTDPGAHAALARPCKSGPVEPISAPPPQQRGSRPQNESQRTISRVASIILAQLDFAFNGHGSAAARCQLWAQQATFIRLFDPAILQIFASGLLALTLTNPRNFMARTEFLLLEAQRCEFGRDCDCRKWNGVRLIRLSIAASFGAFIPKPRMLKTSLSNEQEATLRAPFSKSA